MSLINTRIILHQGGQRFRFTGKEGFPRPGEYYFDANGYIVFTSRHVSRRFPLVTPIEHDTTQGC